MGGHFPWVKDYIRPGTIDEAVSIINDAGKAAAVVAGGTSLAMRLPKHVETLVDLGALGLDKISKTKTGILVGAMTSLRGLEIGATDAWQGVIANACGTVGSRLVRNAVTIGGEMAAGLPWCDMPVLLAVMDARVAVMNGTGDTISSSQWTNDKPTALLGKGLIVEIEIPDRRPGQGLGFNKITRVHGEYAAAVAAARVDIDKTGTITGCRVVAGAVSPHPVALDYVKDALVGKNIDEIDPDAITAPIQEMFKPASDPRFDRDYRRKMTMVATKRAIVQAIKMAKGDK